MATCAVDGFWKKNCETTGLAIFLVAVEAEDTACGTANVASFVALSTLGNAPL